MDQQLLPFAERNFDVFFTVDKRIEKEHALHQFRLGFLIVHVRSNKLESFLLRFPALLTAVLAVRPGQILHVGSTIHRAI